MNIYYKDKQCVKCVHYWAGLRRSTINLSINYLCDVTYFLPRHLKEPCLVVSLVFYKGQRALSSYYGVPFVSKSRSKFFLKDYGSGTNQMGGFVGGAPFLQMAIDIRVNERDRKLPFADGVTIATTNWSELRRVTPQFTGFDSC